MISDSWWKNISYIIYPWDNVPGCSFPWVTNVGNKSSEKQFSLGAIFMGILSGGNLQGDFVRGQLPLKWFSRSNHTLSNYQGAFFLGGNFPLGQLSVEHLSSGAIFRGGKNPGGNCPDTVFSLSPLVKHFRM